MVHASVITEKNRFFHFYSVHGFLLEVEGSKIEVPLIGCLSHDLYLEKMIQFGILVSLQSWSKYFGTWQGFSTSSIRQNKTERRKWRSLLIKLHYFSVQPTTSIKTLPTTDTVSKRSFAKLPFSLTPQPHSPEIPTLRKTKIFPRKIISTKMFLVSRKACFAAKQFELSNLPLITIPKTDSIGNVCEHFQNCWESILVISAFCNFSFC